ncbi:MAG TPA: chloride channel protein [Anaerolineae bacterium]|nr:chloride channel protein [Anaerolineae bacterium]
MISLKSLARWLDRVQPSEAVVMFVLAAVVGVTTGAGVWLFKTMIEIANRFFFGLIGGALSPIGGWTVLLLPVFGGLIVGVLMYRFVGEERHHGVAGIMEAVALAGGRLRYKRIPIKTVAASISIGAGASVGPEDPSVQIGANLGSFFGQVLRQSDDRTRTLVAAGAAGAIAAAFNAPIAGIFFALELIVGELSGGLFGSIALAAVISAVFTQAVSGAEPAFHVPVYEFNSPLELPLYLILGVLAGIISAVYIRAIYKAHDMFYELPAPRWIKPAIAGVLVGVVGIFLPQIFGVGYSTIEQILNGQIISLGLLIALLIAKLILTPVSIGGGFPGGVFAPSLFLGATLGAAFGSIVQLAIPGYPIVPAAFAMVGMAAVLAGAVHAPLTAIILLFEMTNDYRIILPLMFAVVVSLIVSQRLQHDSVYELGLARKGVRLQRGRDVEVLDTISVSEVMQAEADTLLESDPLSAAAEVFAQSRHHGLPVVDARGELYGILTVQDIERVQLNGVDVLTIGQACTREVLTAFPDETIGAALRRMSTRDIGRLPVVARDNRRRLLGVLRRTDLVRAYDLALTRRTTMRHTAQQVRLGSFTGTQVIELTIAPTATCANQSVKAVAWPRDCVLASVRRGRQTLIPHGDTILRPDDVLVAVVEGDAREEVQRLCSASQ